MKFWLDDWSKQLIAKLEAAGALEKVSPEEQTMRILKDPLGQEWVDDDD